MKTGLGQPQHTYGLCQGLVQTVHMFWLEGPVIEAHLAGPTPFGGLQAQDLTITHTPKGVAGLPRREKEL